MDIISQVKDEAKRLIQAGVAIVPIRADGTKKPFGEWAIYRTQKISIDDVDTLFNRRCGIAAITGSPSNGLQAIDFDKGELAKPWASKLPNELLQRLVLVRSGRKSLGYHVHFRCDVVESSCVLAKYEHDGREKIAIETRAEGSLCTLPGGDPNTHSEGLYRYLRGHLCHAPTISPHERQMLLDAAKQLDTTAMHERAAKEAALKAAREALRSVKPSRPANDDEKPWEVFDRTANWADILEPCGWTSRDGIHWTRPGKSLGVSAKVCHADDGTQLLTVFSVSAGPLSPIDKSHRTVSKFEAFKLLHHGGNAKQACYAIRQRS